MKASNVQIRRLKLSDVDSAYRVMWSSWVTAYTPIFGEAGVIGYFRMGVTRLPVLKLWWEALARFPSNAPVVACIEERVVGFLHGQSDTKGDLLVWMLYIDPAHQQIGIGTAMLRHFARLHPWARSIRLEVLSKNLPAIRFYERSGFTVTGRLDQDPDSYSTTYMERTLQFERERPDARASGLIRSEQQSVDI